MSQSRSLRGIDWLTIFMCLVLIVFGIMNIYSVDPGKGMKQLLFFGLSFILIIGLISISSTSSNFFEIYSPLLYITAIVLLIAVLILGKEINGAKAWFNFGFVSFQPAEVAKLATGLLLANYISSPSIEIGSRQTILTSFVIIGLPVGLILLQPDLGSVLVFSAFIVALVREGFSTWYIFIPVIGGVLFLTSISYPSYYILTVIGFSTMIVCLFITAFTYNRAMLKTLMGLQYGLVFFFVVLIILVTFFPEMGAIQDKSAKGYEPIEILQFNVYFFSVVGLVLALISALSVSYFIIRDNSQSPYKMFSPEFGSNRSTETALISIAILTLVSSISLFSSKIYSELPNHQQERIMVLFEGEKKYRDTSGYNLLYSKTAIGSGDLLGKGYLQGTVKMGKFVPEQSTDYIFCTVGEEWGFVGSSLLILFYGLFIIRIYYIAESQRNAFSRFFGYSVATIFLIHFFINIAMVMGLFPTVGIPLPFFSYGGSSLWAFITLITIFLILNYKDRQSLI
ncbi:MAG: rod shape-determining protein RodA [Moheibacter sp.]